MLIEHNNFVQDQSEKLPNTKKITDNLHLRNQRPGLESHATGAGNRKCHE